MTALDAAAPAVGDSRSVAGRWLPALAWSGLVAYGLWGSLTGSEITNDEAWFVQVLVRTLGGEVPYRDFFLHVTPLSLYLSSMATAVLGAELIVVRMVMAAIAIGTYWLTWKVGGRLALPLVARLLVVLAVMVYAPARLPGYGIPYHPLAFLFLLAAFERYLVWRASVSPRSHSGPLLAAAFFAGLGFATKQNVGMLTLAALVVGVAAASWPRARSVLAPAVLRTLAGGFLLGALPPLIPVAASGGLPALIDFGFLGKGVYLTQAGYGYDSSIASLMEVASRPASLLNFRGVYWQVQFLFVWPVLAALLLVVCRHPSDRGLAAGLLGFLLAGVAGIYPLFALPHMSSLIPLQALIKAWCLTRFYRPPAPAWARAMAAGLSVWLLFGLVGVVGMPSLRMAQGAYTVSDLPHMRGVLAPVAYPREMRASADALRTAAHGGTLLLVVANAPALYLVSGLPNPTPFDYALSTDLGGSGQAQLAAMLEDGRLDAACVDEDSLGAKAPRDLVAYITNHLRAEERAGPCTVFRR